MAEGTADTISQDSFDIRSSWRKKLTGSLDQLDARTPPRSLRIRTYSVEEQAEQEAASGTHDRRVRGGGRVGGREGGGEAENEAVIFAISPVSRT